MIRVLALVALAWVQESTLTPAPTKLAPPPTEASVLDEWRDALALDRPLEVLDANRKDVDFWRAHPPALFPPDANPYDRNSPLGQKFASDGRAAALIARAALLAEKDGVIAATKMLDAAKPTVETAAYVELERAHVAIEADELAKALGLLLAKPDATEPRWPTLAASWFETGRALVRSGDSRRAVPFLRRFVELAPHDRDAAAALHMLAREAIDRGDGAMAKQCFERAEQIGRWHGYWRARMTQIREHPDEPLPWQGLAELWLQVGEIDRARAVLQRLVSFKPDFAPGWFLLGETDRKRNDLKAAEFSYTRCLAIDAEHLLARHNRGTIEQMSERHAEARADFEHIADGPRASEPLALNSHLQLVRVLDKLGETDAAAKRYARYAELGGKEPRQP